MKQLKYNTNDNVLDIEIPEEWNIEDLTSLNITIKDVDGVELLASTAVTMYPATTLDGAVSRYAETITLAASATAVSKGDGLLLAGTGGHEVVRVKGYDSTTKVVTLEQIVNNEYDDLTTVYGLFGSYALDTTTTATFVLGMQCIVVWMPSGTGHETRELYQVSKSVTDILALRKRFERLYPRAYSAYTKPVDKFEDMLFEAEEYIKTSLESVALNYERVVDQSITSQVVLALMAYMWTWNGDIEIEEERIFLESEYSKKYNQLISLPIWQDNNQDDTVDDGEVTSHEYFFERNW